MYLYETHLHTEESSICGHTPAAEMVDMYSRLGYDGIFVTDHFYYKKEISRLADKSWDDVIDYLRRGYDTAREAGDKCGLKVFYGWEFPNAWCHLITYGLDYDWLREHPEIPTLTPHQYYRLCREHGGFLVHAHPFREGVGHIELFPDVTDAVEIINACRPQDANHRADIYANMYGFPKTAGSDIHRSSQEVLGCAMCATELNSAADYISALRSGSIIPTYVNNITVKK